MDKIKLRTVGGKEIGECSECGHKACEHVVTRIRELEAKLEAVREWESALHLPLVHDGLGGFTTNPKQVKLRALLAAQSEKED